ncbi:MAG: Lrp/AsnC family transcriptional regulator [Candidatus Pacearchaeota archaeon]|jgi:Lrp/AsnC family leucine-responsive transcriptional regulator
MNTRIDLKDRKILFELNINSRQSNEKIARKVGLSKQAVAVRIKKLQDEEIIDYFFVKLNPTILGFMHIKIYLKLYNLTPNKEKELINDLNQQKGVFWLCSLRGKYDLVVSVYAKSISDFSKHYDKLFDKWREYILERNVFLLEEAYTYSKAYLLPKKEPEEFVYSSGKEEKISLDTLDQKLLSILNKNARHPLIDIAIKLDVSPDTVSYRIKNLQKKGVIVGFDTKINFANINENFYIVSIKLQRMDKKKYDELKGFLKNNKNVITFIKIISDFDIELEVEVLERKDFDDLLTSLRERFPLEVKDYEILEVTKEHRITYFPF